MFNCQAFSVIKTPGNHLINTNNLVIIKERFQCGMRKARRIMFLGTGSDVGKSVITAAFCRIFAMDGYKVAPFKAQNMALNSYITPDGGEMGRAQVVQAEAAGIEPHVDMNPILLKPASRVGSQVIVHGRVIGNMDARTYYKFKKKLLPAVRESYERLASRYDIIVLEGAGSAVELNLKEHDLVNMAMARMADAPVILIGDIDRGGIFASIIGSMVLFTEEERERVKGFLINKFRGDPELFEDGIKIMEEKTGKEVLGVIPYFDHFSIPEEDSVALQKRMGEKGVMPDEKTIPEMSRKQPPVKIGVLRLPYISNYTDFDSLEHEPGVQLVYFNNSHDLAFFDCVIIPGSKTTIHDLEFLFNSGIATELRKFAEKGKTLIGICGGYQMLGLLVKDPMRVESSIGERKGLGLLPVVTTLSSEKVTSRVEARTTVRDWLVKEDEMLTGYEIHMGETIIKKGGCPLLRIVSRNGKQEDAPDGCISRELSVWGTYLHGIFDNDNLRQNLIKELKRKKGIKDDYFSGLSFKRWKETQYDMLARHVREHVDMEKIYRILGI